MGLTEHFTMEELTRSDTARRLGIDNTPDGKELENLKKTAGMMEIVRSLLDDNPISVSSGYRSPKLNGSLVGTSRTSAHMRGQAVDFTCPGFGTPREIVRKLMACKEELLFDQLILEGDAWVHIGFADAPRGQVLYAKNPGTANTVYSVFNG